jgi:HD-GYP domain-containing protein (c-di-GMP phosphodiesterase class II)
MNRKQDRVYRALMSVDKDLKDMARMGQSPSKWTQQCLDELSDRLLLEMGLFE